MSIQVTPIPRLIDLAAPAFTLGTANAAGSAATAVASDATLLAFDTTDPAAVAAAAVVGSATVASRRDHVHPGTTGAGTVVDEAITRFNGTGGSSLQGYSSLSPTISDTGIISLTSGALKFPATAIASADDNTLDDYEQGVWTVGVTFGGNSASMTFVPNGRVGHYTRIGNRVILGCYLSLANKGTSTGNAVLTGLPFPSSSTTNTYSNVSILARNISWANMPVAELGPNSSTIRLAEILENGVLSELTEGNFDNDAVIEILAVYPV